MSSLINGGRPFHRSRASFVGFTEPALTAAVRAGRLARPLAGVYVDRLVPDGRDLRLSCLRLVLPDHAIVCQRSAAWLSGIDVFAPGEQHHLIPEYVVPHHRGRMRHEGVRPVEAVISSEQTDIIGGLRVTTARRTAMDLGRHLHRPMALAALDAFTHQGLVTRDQLQADLDDLRGFPGVRQARELIALTEPKTESPGESWSRLRLIDAGFPLPQAQIVLCDAHGRQVWRIDLGYDELRLGLEYDGMQYHDGPLARQHDDARRADMRVTFGWDVYGFGRGVVLGRHPGLELFVGDRLGIEPRLPRRW